MGKFVEDEEPKPKKVVRERKTASKPRTDWKKKYNELEQQYTVLNSNLRAIDEQMIMIQNEKAILKEKKKALLRNFQQLKTYFRKGTRPSQKQAIANFEEMIQDLI